MDVHHLPSRHYSRMDIRPKEMALYSPSSVFHNGKHPLSQHSRVIGMETLDRGIISAEFCSHDKGRICIRGCNRGIDFKQGTQHFLCLPDLGCSLFVFRRYDVLRRGTLYKPASRHAVDSALVGMHVDDHSR